MRGIDIASYQAGIDLAQVPCDFVIVKATQGTGYVNPDFVRAVDQALAAGKLVGVYHYIDGAGSTGEADHFWNIAGRYNGRVMWCVDWESGSNTAWGNQGYLEAFCRRLTERCGRKLMIYASSSAFPWDLAARLGAGRWVAQYANMSQTGYQGTPWNEGAYSCEIRQYAATGRLPGWGGDLDLNKAYINREQWLAYTGNQEDDMQLTDLVTRPDGHKASVNDVLAYMDQRIERIEAAVTGGGIEVLNQDGSRAGRQTDLATEAAWNAANVLRLLGAAGVTPDQIEQIRQMIADAKVQITVVGPAAEGGAA